LQQAALFLGLSIVFLGMGYLMPANGFVACDWVCIFSHGYFPPFYPPWGELTTRWLNWPLLFSVSMASIVLSIVKQSRHVVSSLAAFLALVKPQVSGFALGAMPSHLVEGVLWLAISLAIWGSWPARMFAVNSYFVEGRYV
jgi:hypothetical protein